MIDVSDKSVEELEDLNLAGLPACLTPERNRPPRRGQAARRAGSRSPALHSSSRKVW
jgi:hypothetical protein